MATAPQQPGRRERNRSAKLARITAAASELFAERGVDDVTTQEIAEAADIGTGTLFLYAKTKGELLLLVQNDSYRHALERGAAAVAVAVDAGASFLDQVLALLTPIVECNRVHVGNGRMYLREMAFGDPTEPQHAEALAIAGRAEQSVVEILLRHPRLDPAGAARLGQVISAIMFVVMAGSPDADDRGVLDLIRAQVAAILPR